VTALLTVDDVAEELGTPVRFVRRLIHERRIRFHKIGKYVRIARADLEEFIAIGAVTPSAPSPGRAPSPPRATASG
jgi:excisionase family DNA binding protein